jgi:hypothetical protein
MTIPRPKIIAAMHSRFGRKTCIVASVCGGIILFAGILLLILQAINSAQDREAMERCTDRQVMAGVSYSLAAKHCKDWWTCSTTSSTSIDREASARIQRHAFARMCGIV